MKTEWAYSNDRPKGYHSGTGRVYKTRWGLQKCTPYLLNSLPKKNYKEPALIQMFGWRDETDSI